MAHFVGLDVSVKETSVCVVDDAGKVVCERKVPTEPDDIAVLLTSIGGDYVRVGIEAGPLSQWLVNGLSEAGLPVICVETRHMKALLQAQQVNKSDRNDARVIAQMMRVGLFKPVHVKTLAAQEQRMLLTSRKLVQRKLIDIESDMRGTLRNFGLKVGVVSTIGYEARIRHLVEGYPRLAAIVEPLLTVRRVMRQQASRLTLTVTEVRVQRLQELNDSDAEAEGVIYESPSHRMFVRGIVPHSLTDVELNDGPAASYAKLWNLLHVEPRTRWASNPKIVALNFQVACGNFEAVEGLFITTA